MCSFSHSPTSFVSECGYLCASYTPKCTAQGKHLDFQGKSKLKKTKQNKKPLSQISVQSQTHAWSRGVVCSSLCLVYFITVWRGGGAKLLCQHEKKIWLRCFSLVCVCLCAGVCVLCVFKAAPLLCVSASPSFLKSTGQRLRCRRGVALANARSLSLSPLGAAVHIPGYLPGCLYKRLLPKLGVNILG